MRPLAETANSLGGCAASIGWVVAMGPVISRVGGAVGVIWMGFGAGGDVEEVTEVGKSIPVG
jgi:hypothetical protein